MRRSVLYVNETEMIPGEKFMLDNWKFKDFAPGEGVAQQVFAPHYNDDSWLPIHVPGDVHSALHEAGIIPDPFYDQNENQLQWIEEREWWYRTNFQGDADVLQDNERLQLTFHGLDTFTTIWLNGVEIGKTQNMFRAFRFDIGKLILPGKTNTLAICFDPPSAHVIQDIPFQSWGINTERISFRKAQFGYGWDWAPRFPTIGIYRPVELIRQKQAAIKGIHFNADQLYPENNSAVISIRMEIDNFSQCRDLNARLQLQDASGRIVWEDTVIFNKLEKISSRLINFLLPEVILWWIQELGEPYLYHLQVDLYAHELLLDSNNTSVGIRTIALDQSVDMQERGTRFFRFILNGVPIFAKGSNWIPADSFPGRLTSKDYKKLLLAAQQGNMNMLRVWGGGFYEHEDFYNLCDRMGILIWQDFMFTCAMYPEAPAPFVDEVKAEASYQVRRLRNHAALALWCGNNENQWIHDKEYWDQPDYPVPGSYYYHTLLPQIVQDYDGHTPYWPGSPYGGNDYNSMTDGDRHNWTVWHGDPPRVFGEKPHIDQSPAGVSYMNYAQDMGRFISEFGMHASPVLATLQRCIPPDQLFFRSSAMDHHNKDFPKNKGNNLMLSVVKLPVDLSEYINFSMITQAEGLKFAIEHYRRRKPHCSGALFWQFNDCWPALSWSVIDYYGFKKAGYYYAKRAYSPVLASFRQLDNGAVQLWITNDLLQEFTDTIIVRQADFSGKTQWEKTVIVQIAANSSKVYWETNKVSLHPDSKHYLVVTSINARFPKKPAFFYRN